MIILALSMDRAAISWVWGLLLLFVDMLSLVGLGLDDGASLEGAPKSVAAAVMGEGPPAASAPLLILRDLIGVMRRWLILR